MRRQRRGAPVPGEAFPFTAHHCSSASQLLYHESGPPQHKRRPMEQAPGTATALCLNGVPHQKEMR